MIEIVERIPQVVSLSMMTELVEGIPRVVSLSNDD